MVDADEADDSEVMVRQIQLLELHQIQKTYETVWEAISCPSA